MKGYKGFKSDMTCRNFQYEPGKTYHETAEIRLCNRGFHFCKSLIDCFSFYDHEDGNRFFEVEADGKIIEGDNKCVCSEITIGREISEIEINRIVYGYGYGDGDGDGYGYGYGYGDGYGYGYGYGDGDGYGYGYGYGDGYGNGKNIQKILNYKEIA